MNQKVEMRPAYNWTCDKCGSDNFTRAIEVEASEEEIREQMELADWEAIPEDFGGSWLSYPQSVACDQCGGWYETESPGV